MPKNILVVDDSDLNIELIIQLIEMYSKEKDCLIDIFRAGNGKEAVEVCAKESIDLVFMDYMMPIMDGNEATKIIKHKYPNIMVIVVSAVGDEKQQKEMLHNGAEDYVVKPLTASVFKSRLHNYIQLVQHRNHIGSIAKPQNLVTSKIYNYYMDFGIHSEEDLSEFWEAMLIRFNFQHQIEYLSDFVRFLYSLGTLQLQQKFKFNITIEEDFEKFYFTLNNILLIGRERVDLLIKKYLANSIYVCQDNKLTFSLKKQMLEKSTSISPTLSVALEDKPSPKDAIISVSALEEDTQIYDILDPEELASLEEYLVKIHSIILLMESSNLDIEEIENLCTYFNSMANLLSLSNDTYVISNSLRDLSNAITENINYFEENSSMLFEFTNAFVNDLLFWKTKIFYEGAPSVDFLNDSITSNANMLNALLKPEGDEVEDLDSIFDF